MKKRKLAVIFFVLVLLLAPVLGTSAGTQATAREHVNERIQALGDDQRILTVIMYHQILKNGKSAYIVRPDTFEQDLIELTKRGFTTVLPSEVIDFVENGAPLPAKPIMITFDDGHYNNIFYGVPLLKKYGLKAVFNIIGAFSDYSSTSGDHSHVAYSHMTWEQIRALVAEGDFEIGNHSYNMHKFKPRFGVLKKHGEDNGTYRKIFREDIILLQNTLRKECKLDPNVFAYPFGKYSELSQKLLLELRFKMIFCCQEKTNTITQSDPACLHKINRYNRDSALSTRAFFDRIEQ